MPQRAAIRQIVDWSAQSHIRWSPPVDPEAQAPLLLAVHGYGQPPDALWAFAAPMAPATAWVVVPEGPSTFYRRPRPQGSSKSGIGHGWVADPARDLTDARNDALLRAAVAGAHAIAPVDPARTWLVAYSQGVGVAVHFALEYPHLVAGIVALAGGIPLAQRPRLERLQGKQVLWITGNRDPSYTPEYSEAVRVALIEAGVELESHVLDAAHDLLAPSAGLVRAWLHPRLQ
jgi:predicted esterase